MAPPAEEQPDPIHQTPTGPDDDTELENQELNNGGEDDEDSDDDMEDDDDENEEEEEDIQSEPRSREVQLRAHRAKLQNLFQRLSTDRNGVPVRVHDVIVKGNAKTKESLIEAEVVELLKNAKSMKELLHAATIANARLKRLDIFDSVSITLDSGPPELPGTANVIVEVVETKSPLTADAGIYTKAEARSSTVEGSIKYKNLFGYGDLWDGCLAYGLNQTLELSAGVFLPRFKGLLSPVMARVSLLSQDWLKFSSYKERSLGLSLGLISTRHHDLSYNLAWRTLTDPSQMASRSIRRQLGHSLLSSLKYTFKIDRRNSPMRPTRGYAFVSTTHIGGLAPDNRSLRFLRQEFDLRYAVPLGFYHTALNLGISSGVVFPWGRGFLNMPSPLPERFFLGGNYSPVCTLGGPLALLGFNTRGMGPTEPRRQNDNSDLSGRDVIGGDLAVTAFADLSFDLPMRFLREKGIHGHVFACAGNLAKLSENEFRNFSVQKFLESFRSSVGLGIIVPTNFFRLELDYCYILKKFEYDRGKTGVRLSFSLPS